APAAPFVGREAELRRLRRHLEEARTGAPQIVFVTGPAGAGKTALVEAFLREAVPEEEGGATWLARGTCLDQHGPREPYLPVLDALGALARRKDAGPLPAILARFAP